MGRQSREKGRATKARGQPETPKEGRCGCCPVGRRVTLCPKGKQTVALQPITGASACFTKCIKARFFQPANHTRYIHAFPGLACFQPTRRVGRPGQAPLFPSLMWFLFLELLFIPLSLLEKHLREDAVVCLDSILFLFVLYFSSGRILYNHVWISTGKLC